MEYTSLTKSELISQVSLDNKSLINTTELITNIIMDNITTILSELITKEIADNKIETETETKLVTSEIIINCDPGFYLPEGDYTENKCKNCSVLGCEICHGNNTINYCDSCFSNYIPKYVNKNLICLPESVKNCIIYDNINFECFKCDDEYLLYQGKCYTYSIGAEYFTDRDNQNIKLINIDRNYIDKIIIDDKMINNSVYYTYFTLKQKGYHKIYFFIKNNPTSFSNLFYDCRNLISIHFSSNINITSIMNLNYMFGYCNSLISVDFSNFDASNVKYMEYMLYNCYNLTI